jgi:serine/threonine-protein kinase
VAIKVMHRELAQEGSYAARFHREARAASRLDHPNSLRVMDFGQEPDGLLYIAMEYVEGRDLYTLMREDWPLSDARIIDILSQALGALATAHEMGVVHRDLKPENIMVQRGKSDDGHKVDVVKVCDFGIAKINEEGEGDKAGGRKLTTQGVVIGTPEYMSPEQARGEKLDARSDIYSMGVILYHLITGRVPFEADTALATVLKHVTEAPPAPSSLFAGVNPRLEAIALKAIEKQRDSRFQDCRAMRADLKSALDAARPTFEGRVPAFLPRASGQTDAHAQTLADTSQPPGHVPPPAMVPPVQTRNAELTPHGAAPARASTPPQYSVPPPAKRPLSTSMVVAGMAVVAVVGLFARQSYYRLQRSAERLERAERTSNTVADPPPVSTAPGPSATPLFTVTTPTASAVVELRNNNVNVTLRTPSSAHAPSANAPAVAPEIPPAPPPAPTPSAVPSAAVPAPTATVPIVPAPPPFSADACDIQVGPVRANGSVNAANLSWSTSDVRKCVYNALKARGTAYNGSVSVRYLFSDQGAFERAVPDAAGLPQASTCLGNLQGKLRTATGDITGAPAFTVGVNVACK